MSNDFFKYFIVSTIAFWIGMFWGIYTHENREEKENAGKETCIICQEQHKVNAAILEELKKQLREKNNHDNHNP